MMKKTEEEMLLLISRLEAVIDSLPFDVWMKGIDGKYQVVNRYMSESLGIAKADLLGKSDLELFPREEAESYISADHSTVERKGPSYYESTRKAEVYEEHKTPVIDQTGEIIAVAGFSKNITQRKRIAEALMESERSKAVLLSNLPGVAYRSSDDINFTMTFLSEGCLELTGYTAEQLLAQKPSYYELIPEEYRRPLFDKWRAAATLNLVSTDEYPIRTASGRIKWVREQSREVYDAKNNRVATEGFIADITENKVFERALRQSEERFRMLFERAPIGMGIFDAQTGNALEVNGMFAVTTGRSSNELIGVNWQTYVHPEELETVQHQMDLLNRRETSSFHQITRLVKPDGSIIWISVTVAPLSAEADQFYAARQICMIEDITSKKNAEEEILYLSYHDQLTGLYNRRFYEEELRRLDTDRNLPITLVMADVNGLKLTNDAFGHLAGDRLLRTVAGIIKQKCRSDDIAARIGGDEFVILLPGTDSEGTERIVERIRAEISAQKVNNVFCSVSFGWETKSSKDQEIALVYMDAENHMYRNKLSESLNMRSETIKVITQTLYQKNRREQLHCERVGAICESIAKAMGFSQTEAAEMKTAGLLHDIGKIGIDERLLAKPGKLNDAEWNEIKRHPEIGFHILRSASEFAPIADAVLYHHERIDGRGYPRMLKGNEIPTQAKMITLADAFDAMTTERTYAPTLSVKEAIKEIQRNIGTQFDREIAEIFIEKVLAKEEL